MAKGFKQFLKKESAKVHEFEELGKKLKKLGHFEVIGTRPRAEVLRKPAVEKYVEAPSFSYLGYITIVNCKYKGEKIALLYRPRRDVRSQYVLEDICYDPIFDEYIGDDEYRGCVKV